MCSLALHLSFCSGPFFSFSIKLKKCQGRQGECRGVGSDAVVCPLWAHFSSAGVHQTDASRCQQLNRPGFEGAVLYGLSPAMSANVFECLASRRLIQSSLLSSSSSTRWQRTSCSRRQSREEVTSLCGDGEGRVGSQAACCCLTFTVSANASL